MGIFILIGLFLALLLYALIMKFHYDSILDLVGYSNEKKIKIFNRMYSSYFSAISDGQFIDKLVFSNKMTKDDRLNLKLKTARRKVRLMFLVNVILIIVIFIFF